MVKIEKTGRTAVTTVDVFEVSGAPDMYRGRQRFRPESIVRTTVRNSAGTRVGVAIRGTGQDGTLDGCRMELIFSNLDDVPDWALPALH